MDWWDTVGAYAQLFPDAPALAVDMATRGPNPDVMGINSAAAVQASPIPFTLYTDQDTGD